MSEYQYYEFRAVDRPLTPEQMSELRALSSRATITSRSFTNTYNYGSFRGNPSKLMETYFDAHVYVSNFGTSTFMLRLPRTIIPDEVLAQYASDYGLEWRATNEHTIIEWRLEEDGASEWMEGEGWMDQLLPIRDELVLGDYRSLYIGWLSAIESIEAYEDEEDENSEDEADDSEDLEDAEEQDDSQVGIIEPPVPAGLGSLTVAQTALAEFLGVGSDLLAAAAKASPALPAKDASNEKVAGWVAQLPEPELRILIARIIHGEGLRIQAELQSSYYHALSASADRSPSIVRRRTATEIVTMAEQAIQARERREAEARESKRRAHLDGLIPRFTTLWATVNTLAEEQKSSSYDKVCTLLVDMRDAYSQANRRAEFDVEFVHFVERYSRRTALIRRLKETHLITER